MLAYKVSIHLSLGSACNLNCKYCFKDIHYKKPTKEEIIKLIDRIFEVYKVEEINSINLFSSSEPFLDRELFWELYNYVNQKGLYHQKISFTTNGTLLDLEKDLDRFKKHSYCMISCDGTREQHNANRIGAKDYYDTIKQNVQTLSKAGVRCVASTVINADDTSMFETALALKEMGFSAMIPKVVRKMEFSDEEMEKLQKKYSDFYTELENRIISKGEVYWINFFGLNQKMRFFLKNMTPQRFCEHDYPDLMTITLDGSIHKCDYDTSANNENAVANIFDPEFNKRRFERIYEKKAAAIQKDQECQNKCEFFKWCGGKTVFCQKIDYKVECLQAKERYKHFPNIVNFLRNNYTKEAIKFIASSIKVNELFGSNDPESLLHVDELYNDNIFLAELKNSLQNKERENYLRSVKNLDEIYRIVENVKC